MKIGILSLNPGHNYGGILQSYALQTVLEKMHHSVYVISYDRHVRYYNPKLYPKYIFRFFKKYFCFQNIEILAEKHSNELFVKANRELLNFCRLRLHLCVVKSLKKIKNNEYDAIIVGSDQVWRPQYFKRQFSTTIDDAYLKFAKDWNVRRVAYAPSFGVEKWEYSPEETKSCCNLLRLFDGVSVREQSGVVMCKEHFNVDAMCLCDPTMLLSKEEYERLIPESFPKSNGNLLVYCLDVSEELESLVEKVSKDSGLIPFYTNIDERNPHYVKGSVEAWIRGFMDAKFVITDSYHACVFSLIFRKPFVVLGNRNRGISRFVNLLNTFNQEHRLLYNTSDYNDALLSQTFEHVGDIFTSLKKDSLDYLKAVL